ncbi:MAG TPA: 16S rRNA (cytidine(1402)-2'-O)-methyltransferase, partial [Planctomycetota bacterium]|nr:16S rRNA (cytidine(1402)-2'-O)-methyltransferase [Planctomycetota bacterium]
MSIVATPIGNLEDLTLRAARVLGEAEIIAAEDTRRAGELLAHLGKQGARVMSLFEGNEAQRTAELVELLAGGARVALISDAGTPGISDPGQRLVAAAHAAGVRVEIVPGPSAAIAALVLSGLPSDRFLFAGFPPRDTGARHELFGSLRAERATLIFYEAPPRVGTTLAELAAALGGGRPVVLARELTKLHEEAVRGTLDELAARYAAVAPRGECTLVVAGAPEAPVELDLEAETRILLA